MKSIITKIELIELLIVDDHNLKSIEDARSILGEYYDIVFKKMLLKTDAFFIRSFKNRGYEIKLLLSCENSKFLLF